MRFCLQVDSEERETWAAYVCQSLKTMNEPAKRQAWDSWIETYWKKRISGIPAPLDGPEIAAMLHWTPQLGEAFPESVVKAIESPFPAWGGSPVHFLYEDLSATDLPERYPGPATRLLLRLLQSGLLPQPDFVGVDEIVKRLASAGAPKQDLVRVCEELARIGDTQANRLRNAIETGPDDHHNH